MMQIISILLIVATVNIVDVARASSAPMRYYEEAFNGFFEPPSSASHSIQIQHFIDALHQDPSLRHFVDQEEEVSTDSSDATDKSVTSSSPSLSSSWVQGGYMSLNYYYDSSSSATPTCALDKEFIYTGVNMGQCITDLYGKGNSYFFSCNSSQVNIKSYLGPNCAAKVFNSTYAAINTCSVNKKVASGVNQMFTCSSSANIVVPTNTIVNAAHYSNECDCNIMGYLGIAQNTCNNLGTICSILGTYSSLSKICTSFPPQISVNSVYVTFSCSDPTTPYANAFLGSCSGSAFPPKQLSTVCNTVTDTVNGKAYTQSSQFYCASSTTNALPAICTASDDSGGGRGGTSSISGGGLNSGAIAGGVIGGLIAVALVYYAFTKYAGMNAANSNKGLASKTENETNSDL